MLDKQLTDSEIVKALEELCDNAFKKLENPIKRKEKIKIWDVLCKSLDLINRLQCERNKYRQKVQNQREEINRIQAEKEHYSRKEKVLAETIYNYKQALEQVKAENERFKSIKNSYDFAEYRKQEIKAEAYKECIEKVKERIAVHSFTSNSTEYTDGMLDCMEWVDSKIEELEKELVGEDNG